LVGRAPGTVAGGGSFSGVAGVCEVFVSAVSE